MFFTQFFSHAKVEEQKNKSLGLIGAAFSKKFETVKRNKHCQHWHNQGRQRVKLIRIMYRQSSVKTNDLQ